MTVHSNHLKSRCDLANARSRITSGIFSDILSIQDVMDFVHISESQIDEYCLLASEIRDHGKGNVITFSPKVFIPLTRLCRDFCGYCTFRQDPSEADELYLSPEQVLEVVNKVQALGCTEALFTLGERPELRYREAMDWLKTHGYDTTIEYLVDMCRLVSFSTSLIPHVNPGTMSYREMSQLRPHSGSMGIMLESISENLHVTGGPHEFAPSKRPSVRIKTTKIAGELNIPFTSGILIGIGESRSDRIEALFALHDIHKNYGNIQEVIIQNFRTKDNIPMRDSPDAESLELRWTIATARIILGSQANIQVPPNLNSEDYDTYISAGINDWGGVSPLTIDYVNPESPWPKLSELNRRTSKMGFNLVPRLPIYPEYFMDTDRYTDVNIKRKLLELSDDQGYVKGGIQAYVDPK